MAAAAPGGADAFPEISPDDLAALLKKGDSGVVVLDVRNPDEIALGRIKGSVAVTAKRVKAEDGDTADVDAFIREHAAGAKKIAVHCMGCQQRGPTSARALAARLAELGSAPSAEVAFITGGVLAFMDKHGADETLVEVPEGGWKVPM